MTDETDRPLRPDEIQPGGNGRRYLLGAAATVVVFAGIAGYTLGSNSPAETVRLLSVLVLPVSGLSLAAYGVALAGVVVTGLFTVVRVLSRFDDAAE
ncbi:hypothetical protein [Halobaculum sp. MBLA0143]|uniref:DUF7520 family protein n=1 Tax=Halobaculum sp. MBLA0143 TaxID=3079933 RepID=UPI003526BDC1